MMRRHCVIHNKAVLLHIIGLLVTLLFLSSLYMANVATAEVTLDDIWAGISHNESLLKSQRGTLVVKMVYTDAGKQDFVAAMQESSRKGTAILGVRSLVTAVESIIDYSFVGKKFRYDIKTIDKEWDWEENRERENRIETKVAYDGETLTEQKITLRDISQLMDSNYVTRVNPWFNPKYWGIDVKGRSLVAVMKMMNPKLVSPKALDGNLCYIIESESKDAVTRFWFDPQMGYGLRKIEFSSPTKYITTTNLFKEVSKGIWVPYYEEYKDFLVDPDTGEQTLASRMTREIRDFQVNVVIPDELFRIAFEKGTEVFDARMGTYRTIE